MAAAHQAVPTDVVGAWRQARLAAGLTSPPWLRPHLVAVGGYRRAARQWRLTTLFSESEILLQAVIRAPIARWRSASGLTRPGESCGEPAGHS